MPPVDYPANFCQRTGARQHVVRFECAIEPGGRRPATSRSADSAVRAADEPIERSLAPPIVHAPVETPPINRTRMPAGFYASPEARSTLNQLPGPAPVQSAPRLQTTRRGGKPFQAIPYQPTISPYLYLNAGTNRRLR